MGTVTLIPQILLIQAIWKPLNLQRQRPVLVPLVLLPQQQQLLIVIVIVIVPAIVPAVAPAPGTTSTTSATETTTTTETSTTPAPVIGALEEERRLQGNSHSAGLSSPHLNEFPGNTVPGGLNEDTGDYNMVIDLSQFSLMNIWGLVVVCLLTNCTLFWCFCRKSKKERFESGLEQDIKI